MWFELAYAHYGLAYMAALQKKRLYANVLVIYILRSLSERNFGGTSLLIASNMRGLSLLR